VACCRLSFMLSVHHAAGLPRPPFSVVVRSLDQSRLLVLSMNVCAVEEDVNKEKQCVLKHLCGVPSND